MFAGGGGGGFGPAPDPWGGPDLRVEARRRQAEATNRRRLTETKRPLVPRGKTSDVPLPGEFKRFRAIDERERAAADARRAIAERAEAILEQERQRERDEAESIEMHNRLMRVRERFGVQKSKVYELRFPARAAREKFVAGHRELVATADEMRVLTANSTRELDRLSGIARSMWSSEGTRSAAAADRDRLQDRVHREEMLLRGRAAALVEVIERAKVDTDKIDAAAQSMYNELHRIILDEWVPLATEAGNRFPDQFPRSELAQGGRYALAVTDWVDVLRMTSSFSF